MSYKSRFRAVVSVAAIAAIIAASLPSPTVGAAASSKSSVSASGGITVTLNEGEYQPQSEPYVKNGTVYLPLRDMGELLGTVVFWSSASKTVTMTYPELTVKLNYGSNKATVNGKEVALTAPISTVKGRIFVPLRFLSEVTGANVKWNDKTRTVSVTHTDNYARGGGVNVNAWLKRGTGDLYIAHPYEQQPVRVGKVDGEFNEYISINSHITSSGNMLLTIVDNYGEPHVHYNAYGILVRNHNIVDQKQAKYFQRYEENAIAYFYQDQEKQQYVERSLLTDGRTLTVYDDQGTAIKKYDLPTLTGKDEIHAVLGANEDYLVVRPNKTGFITVINLKDSSAVEMYSKLLTGEDLNYATDNDTPYHGDVIRFLGEDPETGLLGFSYDSPLNSDPVQLLGYDLDTGKIGVLPK